MRFIENPEYDTTIKTYRLLNGLNSFGTNGNKTCKSVCDIFDTFKDAQIKEEISDEDLEAFSDEELKRRTDRLYLEKKYRTLKYEKDHFGEIDKKTYIFIAANALSIVGFCTAFVIVVKRY
jgi:hypothetical protein